jgi:hypothetical protein
MAQLLLKLGMGPVTWSDTCQQRGSVPPPAEATNQHAPPTTTNASGDKPPPLPSRQHSHVPGVAHKRATQILRPVHATAQETPQRRAATPTAEEHTSAVPYHVANGPNGPSVVLTCGAMTRPKRRPTTQCCCSGTEVHCPPHSMEITIYQPRILVEYCDLMTSISTVS